MCLQLKEIDGWPSGICQDCKSKLMITTNFFEACKRTEIVLQDEFGELLSSTFDESDFEESSESENCPIYDFSDDSSANEELLEEIIPLQQLKEKLNKRKSNKKVKSKNSKKFVIEEKTIEILKTKKSVKLNDSNYSKKGIKSSLEKIKPTKNGTKHKSDIPTVHTFRHTY